ncbi:hypothetical protein GCM10020331_101010 [Ectobacillus funiculus]
MIGMFLELKARIRRISVSLGKYLPQKYEEALNVLFKIDEECTGFPYLFFPDFCGSVRAKSGTLGAFYESFGTIYAEVIS